MLLSNPFASSFWPTLETIFISLFGGSLLALLVGVRDRSVLLARWRTWLVIAPLFTLAVLSGPLPLALLAAAIALQGAREYSRLVGLSRTDDCVLYLLSAALPLMATLAGPTTLPLLIMVAPLGATIGVLLEQDIERGVDRVARLAFGIWYLPTALACMVAIGGATPGALLALGLAVALSDVGAFTCGKLFGCRPLALELSPSKTWAGIVGNFVGAALGLWLLHPLEPDAPLFVLVPLIAVGAAWGDLLESLLKRSAGAKDAGHWLPGFGGLLDRVDSLLVVLPLAFVAFRVIA